MSPDQQLSNDPQSTRPAPEPFGAPRVFRRGRASSLVTAVGAAVMVFASVVLMVGALAAMTLSILLGFAMALMAAFIVLLTRNVLLEAIGQWQLRIEIATDRVMLRLPRRRGYVPLPPIERTVAFESIAGIDTRLESFRYGFTMLQRAWALRLQDGSRIVLGADRPLIENFFEPAAIAIADAADRPVRDIGAVDGRAGFLAVCGVTVPDWDSTSLSEADIDARAVRSVRAWRIVGYVFALLTLVQILMVVIAMI